MAGNPEHERRITKMETEREKLSDRLAKVERFQAWISGLAVGVGFVAGFFSDFLKRHLGI